MITASSSIGTSVEAMKNGAYDYLVKPFNADELTIIVKRALEYRMLRREIDQQKVGFGLKNLIGHSNAAESLANLIKTVSASQATTVLLCGESGTGKDMAAKIIHNESPRAGRPFMNITCTALQDTLLESELFGHEKGSFTDAKVQKKGLIELANGGTVFMDEIGDMSPSIQAKILRLLDEKTFRRVGGTQDIKVDIRLIAATNRNLEKLIQETKFREDLYYRLNVITIHIPPLRERREDIGLLVRHFLKLLGGHADSTSANLSEETLRKLQNYDWPGNIRELKNVIERALILGSNSTIGPDDIILGRISGPTPNEKCSIPLPANGINLQEVEKDLLVQALERTGGNQTKAGELLGMTRDQIHYRMEKFGLIPSTS
jgi:two-component system, NtrC family, response regulator AtoC